MDVVFVVADVGGYEALIIGARSEDVAGAGAVPIASLDDVISSKRAADRPKDRRVLPELDALRQRGERPD